MAKKKPLVMYKFGATWCGPCQTMKRAGTLEKLGAKYPDLLIKAIDVELREDMANEFNVQAMPTFVIDDRDGFEVAREEGAMPFSELCKFYEAARETFEEDDYEKEAREPPEEEDENEYDDGEDELDD